MGLSVDCPDKLVSSYKECEDGEHISLRDNSWTVICRPYLTSVPRRYLFPLSFSLFVLHSVSNLGGTRVVQTIQRRRIPVSVSQTVQGWKTMSGAYIALFPLVLSPSHAKEIRVPRTLRPASRSNSPNYKIIILRLAPPGNGAATDQGISSSSLSSSSFSSSSYLLLLLLLLAYLSSSSRLPIPTLKNSSGSNTTHVTRYTNCLKKVTR